MIIDLFINACILIAFISVADDFLKNKNITQDRSLLLKVLTGVFSGLLGMLLMLFSVHITHTVITDFRTIPIMIAAIFGGIISSVMTAIIMCFFRVLYFGISKAAIISVIATMFSGVGLGIISNLKNTRKDKWVYSVIYSMVVSTIAYIILINDKILLAKFLIIYYIGFLLVSYLVFRYIKYLTELAKFYNKLKNEATIDFLTGINNVRQFDKSFNDLAKQTVRKGESLSLLFIDIDHFKKVNDTYGHSSGDVILKTFANILSDTCRSFDVVSRNGGEEFSAILLDCSSRNAIKVAEKIREKVEAYSFYISEEIVIKITVSIGVSTYPDITDDIDSLLGYADKSLYKAKRTGRNKVVLYKED